MIARIGIKDEQLKNNFQIDLLGITLNNESNELYVSFFGNGHRDIILKLNPLEKSGSGTITDQDLIDNRVAMFEKFCEKD